MNLDQQFEILQRLTRTQFTEAKLVTWSTQPGRYYVRADFGGGVHASLEIDPDVLVGEGMHRRHLLNCQIRITGQNNVPGWGAVFAFVIGTSMVTASTACGKVQRDFYEAVTGLKVG